MKTRVPIWRDWSSKFIRTRIEFQSAWVSRGWLFTSRTANFPLLLPLVTATEQFWPEPNSGCSMKNFACYCMSIETLHQHGSDNNRSKISKISLVKKSSFAAFHWTNKIFSIAKISRLTFWLADIFLRVSATPVRRLVYKWSPILQMIFQRTEKRDLRQFHR